ncbi:MAG TPA: hypothetical protein VL947_03990 [Cytophagales bacterium]|nr:hypothetical protein [Cytophagales bacterium]
MSIFVYTYIQAYRIKYLDLIILFFTTFVVFYVSTLFKNPFLRKHFWIGVTVSLLSSWITADFYRFELDVKRFEIDPNLAVPIITADSKSPHDTVVRFTNYNIQERFKGVDTFKLNTGTIKYFAYPIVDNDWGTTDSIIYWACYKYQTVFFGKKHRDYIAQMVSSKGVGFEIKEEVNKRKFSDALRRSVYNNNLKLSDHYKLLEFIDYEYETQFWHNRMIALIIIANLVWLSLVFVKAPTEQDT